jgi:hypothetical protein
MEMRLLAFLLVLSALALFSAAPVEAVPLSVTLTDHQAPTVLDFYGACGDPGGILHTLADGGMVFAYENGTWRESWNSPYDVPTFALHRFPNSDLLALVWGFGAYRREGTRWRQLLDPRVQHILEAHIVSDDEFWATGIQGKVFAWRSGFWSSEGYLDQAMFKSIDRAPGGGSWWVGGLYGALYRRQASAWSLVPFDVNISVMGIAAVDEDEVHFCGWRTGLSGVLLEFDGQDFFEHQPAPRLPLYRLRRGPGGTLWAAGMQGQAYRYEGGLWQRLDIDIERDFYEVLPLAADRAVFVGTEGTVLEVAVTGLTPTPTPPATPSPDPTATPEPPLPRVLLAGYWDTALTATHGGVLTILAACTATETVEVAVGGVPSGFFLPPLGPPEDGLFGLLGVSLTDPLSPGLGLFEFAPAGPTIPGPLWPYLEVR